MRLLSRFAVISLFRPSRAQSIAFIPAALILLVILGIYWSGAAGNDQRADFTFINRGDNKSLDLNTMSWMQDIRLAYALWEGLYTLDPVTLKPIPGTAETIDIDSTQTIYTFHIRRAARWSNGDPVTAHDYEFEWRRMLETPGEYSYLFGYIKGAQEYSDAFQKRVKQLQDRQTDRAAQVDPPPDFHTVGIDVIDDHTLRVTLKHPVTFFPSLCAFPAFFPMNAESMKHYAKADEITGVVTYDQKFTRELVTNGPYMMTEWSFKRRIRMEANEYYWDRANVKSRIIDQIYDEDGLGAYRAFTEGSVDWIADADPDIAAELLAHGGHPELHIFTAFGTYYYTFNCNAKLPDGSANPLVDARVRRALGMAIDKTPIVRDVGRLHQPITSDYIPPNVFPGYTSPGGLAHNPAAAQQLLSAAGYPGGHGFPRLSILFNSEGAHKDVAQIIRRQWLSELGIEVDLEGVEVKVFGARLHSQQFSIARTSWYGDYDDPSTFTDKYRSAADGNDPKWKNEEYDRLCNQAELETDVPKRLGELSHAEAILLNDAPIVPLYHYVNAYLFNDNVKGIPLSPSAMIMLKSVEVLHR